MFFYFYYYFEYKVLTVFFSFSRELKGCINKKGVLKKDFFKSTSNAL